MLDQIVQLLCGKRLADREEGFRRRWIPNA